MYTYIHRYTHVGNMRDMPNLGPRKNGAISWVNHARSGVKPPFPFHPSCIQSTVLGRIFPYTHYASSCLHSSRSFGIYLIIIINMFSWSSQHYCCIWLYVWLYVIIAYFCFIYTYIQTRFPCSCCWTFDWSNTCVCQFLLTQIHDQNPGVQHHHPPFSGTPRFQFSQQFP